MDEKTQRKIFQYFKRNKIENFVGVPDSTLKHFMFASKANFISSTRLPTPEKTTLLGLPPA